MSMRWDVTLFILFMIFRLPKTERCSTHGGGRVEGRASRTDDAGRALRSHGRTTRVRVFDVR